MSQPEKPVHVVRDRYPEPVYPTAAIPIRPRAEASETNHLWEYLNVLLARRYTIVAVLVTVVTISMIRTYKEVPIYRATARIQIDKENQRFLNSDVYGPQLQQEEVLQTQYKVLSSRSLAREVIKDLGLDKLRSSQPPPPPSSVANFIKGTREVASAVFHLFFSSRKPSSSPAAVPLPEVQEENDPLRPFVDSYLGNVGVNPVVRTRLVDVSFDSPDPRLAAMVINKHAEDFRLLNLKAKLEATQFAQDFLKEQMETMKAKLEEAEDKLQGYSQQHQILFLEEGKNADTAKLVQLSEELTKAQSDRIAKISAAKQLRDQGGPVDANADSRLAELRREDAKLKDTYQPDYPKRKDIRNQIEAIEATILKERDAAIRRADAEAAAATARENLFQQAFDAQRARVDRMNQDIVQYNINKEDAKSQKALLTTLQQKLLEADLAHSLEPSNIRIVDRAEVPGGPIRPEKNKALLNSLAVGLALGIGLAFFQEYMDSSFKSPDDITKFMKLATLAVIPRLGSVTGKGKQGYGYGGYGYGAVSSYFTRKKKGESETPADPTKPKLMELVTHEEPSSLVSEAYRSLRASLILSAPDHPPRTILVTSSIPSEGKTSTTANLAVSLTQIGAKVALIDGDMRKPRMAKIFGLEQKAGLSNFLTGTEQFKDVIHETPVPGLFLIPCGVIPPNPSELILSNRFKQMLEVLRKYFDYVIVDSPPLNNVSDARIYATNVDAVVVVVKALSTSRHVVSRAMAHLEDSRTRIAGVVLNDFDVKSKGSYYYSYGSGRYYQQYYYQSSDEEKEASKKTEKN